MSPPPQIHAKISGPIVSIVFGSIVKGTLAADERHFDSDNRASSHRSAMRTARIARQPGVLFH